ncbi:MAG TPA: class I SAM-dependent methyltransferase [Thermoanaerobaculia bacterium]|nr:class I SAM-dependent methyltransferase [Thermoanaerobaculia bacterium]
MDQKHFFLHGKDDSPLVAALHADLVERSACLTVDARDEMFNAFYYGRGESIDLALHMYLESGRHIWRSLRRVLESHFGRLGAIESVLDFAAGYGRVTRHMAMDLAPDRIWMSEIDPGAVEFQERTFGVHGLQSTFDPQAFDPGRDFSCVLVSSLFTHLPEARFVPWLERLLSLVREGGLLAFSVHDMSLAPEPASRFLFHPSSESGSLSHEEYGSTWVTESFVREVLAPSGFQVCRVPRGLASLQDLYVVRKASPKPLAFRGGLDGFVEECRLDTRRRLLLQGWVMDRHTKEAVREVRFLVDGDLAGRTEALSDRPEIATLFPGDAGVGQDWQAEIALPDRCDPSRARLCIAAVGSDGFLSTLAEGSIASFLTRVALYRRLESEHENAVLKEMLRSERERFAEQLALAKEESRATAALRNEILDLEIRIAAMKSSRFWKLRDRWFALKRRLRLTNEA